MIDLGDPAPPRKFRTVSTEPLLPPSINTRVAQEEPCHLVTRVQSVLPTYSGNTRSFHRGYEAAEMFRDRYGLGVSPIADVAILADEVGVVVARMPLGDDFDSPDGCSAVDPETGACYVLINSDKPRIRRRFTIAHELGHLALGHLLGGQVIVDETVGGKSPEEKQANAFAAGFLMPAEGVRGAVKRLRKRLGNPPSPLN